MSNWNFSHFSIWNCTLLLKSKYSFIFHDIFKISLLACGHGTVCHSCLSYTINFVKGNEHAIEPWLTSKKWDAAGDPRTIIVTCTTLEENKFRCKNDPCENNGKCYGGISSFYCDCSLDWTGKMCTIPGILVNNE